MDHSPLRCLEAVVVVVGVKLKVVIVDLAVLVSSCWTVVSDCAVDAIVGVTVLGDGSLASVRRCQTTGAEVEMVAVLVAVVVVQGTVSLFDQYNSNATASTIAACCCFLYASQSGKNETKNR